MSKEKRLIKKIGQGVRELRQELNLSQMALAAEAGLDKSYIGLIERGEVNMTLGSLLKISEALGAELLVEIRKQRRTSK